MTSNSDETKMITAVEKMEEIIFDLMEDYRDTFPSMIVGEKFIEIPISLGVVWKLTMGTRNTL